MISSVSFAGAQTQTQNKHKMDPVKKFAIIGGSIGVATNSLITAGLSKTAKESGTTLKELLEKSGSSLGKYIGKTALAIGIATLFWAGIGKLVKNHQEKKSLQESNAQNLNEINNKLDKKI